MGHVQCSHRVPGQPRLRHSFEQPRPLPQRTVPGLSLTERPGPHSFSPRPPEPLELEQSSSAHAVFTLASHLPLPLPGTASGGGVFSTYLATASRTKRRERLEDRPDPRTRNWSQSLLQATPPPAARLLQPHCARAFREAWHHRRRRHYGGWQLQELSSGAEKRVRLCGSPWQRDGLWNPKVYPG